MHTYALLQVCKYLVKHTCIHMYILGFICIFAFICMFWIHIYLCIHMHAGCYMCACIHMCTFISVTNIFENDKNMLLETQHTFILTCIQMYVCKHIFLLIFTCKTFISSQQHYL